MLCGSCCVRYFEGPVCGLRTTYESTTAFGSNSSEDEEDSLFFASAACVIRHRSLLVSSLPVVEGVQQVENHSEMLYPLHYIQRIQLGDGTPIICVDHDVIIIMSVGEETNNQQTTTRSDLLVVVSSIPIQP